MSLSTAEIKAVVEDLAPRLEGARTERIDQPDGHRVIFRLRRGRSRYWLQLVAHPRFSRLHLLTRRPEEGRPAGGFCNVLRQHLTGSPIQSIRQTPNDRVVTLEFIERDTLLRSSPIRLVAELTGTGSNLILVDKDGRILGAMFTQHSERRRIVPGVPYKPLPPPDELSGKALSNRFADLQRDAGDELALSRAIQNTYAALEAQATLEERRAQLRSLVRARLKALGRRVGKLERDMESARDAEHLRREGELLKIALPQLKKGQDSLVVRDVFDPHAPEVTITLDPTCSPQRNVERRFERYKKLKASRAHVEERLSQTQRELSCLEALESELEAAQDAASLDTLAQRARELGLARPEKRAAAAQAASHGPRQFLSSDGLEILVARNRRQNHELTFSLARGNDYWMHLLGWEGPHVIIRKPRGKDVPLGTLLDAAHLAVHFSKIRGADHAEVVYTQRKHVQPIKGAQPGTVRYANVTRMAVRLEQERLRQVLDRAGGLPKEV